MKLRLGETRTMSHKLVAAVFIVFALVLLCKAEVKYKGYKVYRVNFQNENEYQTLKAALQDEYDVWREAASYQDFLDVMVSPGQESHFQNLVEKLEHKLFIEDIQELIDNTEQPTYEDSRSYNDSRYYNLEEIDLFLYEMVTLCRGAGSDCQLLNIGYTYEERPLEIVKLGRTSDNRPSIWLDCGIHAREWISPAVCQYIINQLVTLDGNDTDVTALRNLYDWYVHPVVNADGYSYTWSDDRMWRKTRKPNQGSLCVGTDGNRNFLRGWGGEGSSTDPCSETYRGSEPFSEPETKAIEDFIQPIAPFFEMALTVHSYGQFFVYPWGYTTDEDPENIEDMATVAAAGEAAIRAVHGEAYTGRRSNGDMAGNTIDWAHGEANIALAYLFEVRDTGDYGFLLPPDQIRPTGEEIWAGVKAMAFALQDLPPRKK